MDRKWHHAINKLEWVPTVAPWARELLDLLEELSPMGDEEDRYVRMAVWLESSQNNGLLKPNEHHRLRTELAQAM